MSDERTLDLVHLRRETRTALELAIVGAAPTSLVDRLATVTGLLEALAELPLDGTTRALATTTVERARGALEIWRRWERDRVPVA